VVILIGICIALFSQLGVVELRGEEPRRAIVAMEMDITGEYIVPKINGWNYYNKPPLFNWLLAGCFKLFDSYANWALRIPSILALLLTAILHYFFSKKYLSNDVALLSALLFVTSGDIFFYGSQLAGEMDLFFSLLVYTQVILMYHFSRKQKYISLFLATYLLTALGVLTKGLPSIVFQGVTLLAWLAYTRQLRLLLTWMHLAGIISFVTITGLYFYLYAQEEDVVPFLVNLIKKPHSDQLLKAMCFQPCMVLLPIRLIC
jgi:4-amino-4-deoxy-L-arabinose transferase-like glycosyltransferase